MWRHPIFGGILVTCLTSVFAETWLIGRQIALVRSSYARSERLGTELRILQSTVPPLNLATTAVLSEELSDARKALADLRAELKADGAAVSIDDAVPPMERADGYFLIASFVETMRENAQRRGVRVKSDERFGFADYAHTGPEVRDLPRVLRERHATEVLLNAVFDARPRQLLSMQRERRSAAGDARTGAVSSGGTNVRADYFDWDARESIRQAGSIDTLALRVSFVSETSSLRSLLNQLAELGNPLVVRSVEVGPFVKSAERATEASEPESPKPLVPRSLSRFTVTVELIEWIDAPETQS